MVIDWNFPHSSRRMPVLARNAVATSQPLAAQAGLAMLARGGNAVDAALAVAIALTIVEPTSNGIGGDLFAIVWDSSRLHGLNASGRSPAAWTPQRFAGRSEMPLRGWDSVTVPGAVDGWVRLSQRFGRLRFEELFGPAIDYARHGYVVSPITAQVWSESAPLLTGHAECARVFLPNRRAPAAGEMFRMPDAAATLEEIAQSRGESFYRGRLAHRIAAQSAAEDGAMSPDDLATYESQWVEPLSQPYRGVHVHELPPNGQGVAALIALGVLEHFDLASLPADSADCVHLQIEAMKIAFAEAHRHLADPTCMELPTDALLGRRYLSGRAAQIRIDAAASPRPIAAREAGTVYLTAADESGMMVSLIQSNFHGFGAGIVVEGTGISLQNRGFGFVLPPGHPNQVGPRKRPYHTIIPAFMTRNGRPLMSFGVMGGHMQPQGHVQVVTRMIDHHHNPQAALDAPRWHVLPDFSVALETGWPEGLRRDLIRRGHRLLDEGELPPGGFGGGQIIRCLADGYCAASDPRKDGQAVGF